MKRPIGLLIEEKSRLKRILRELNKEEFENTDSDTIADLLQEIQRDIECIDTALEAIEEYVDNLI